MHRAQLRLPGTLALLLPLALASGTAGCGTTASTATSPEVARVGDRAITRDELDDWIKDELFREASEGGNAARLYELRSGALDRMIEQTALEAAAAERGISESVLLEQEIEALGPVTDAEVEAFFEANRERIPPDQTLEGLREDIRRHLRSLRREQAAAAVRERAAVVVLLDAPRAPVEPTGPSRGPADAAVTLVEFSDYQCPYCRRAEPTIAALLERYPDELRVVYRHLPLDFHANARPAAIAAVCADRQGRFWDYHELLFANQQQLDAPDLRRYAEQLALDLEDFDACRESEEASRVVETDVRAAGAAGASGTPAFFVNGILLTGARPIEAFAEVIDRELARLESSGDSGSAP